MTELIWVCGLKIMHLFTEVTFQTQYVQQNMGWTVHMKHNTCVNMLDVSIFVKSVSPLELPQINNPFF